MYELALVTAPTIEPLTLAEVRTHLNLGGENVEPTPAAATAALASPAVAGNVDNGAHRYRVTFVTADGETDGGTISSAVTVADKTVNGKVELTAIPLGGSAVTARKLYRTAAAGSTYYLLATLSDNTTTTYTDNIADSSLGAEVPSTNTTGDPYLTALVKVARRRAEADTGRALITQTWDLTLDGFPVSSDCPIQLPLPPCQSVTSISYYDTAGTLQTWSSSYYQVAIGQDEARIRPIYGQVYPSTYARMQAVTVRFVAGYGAAASAVPDEIRHALKLMIGHWHQNREDLNIGNIVTPIDQQSSWLLNGHRVLRFV